MVEYPGSPRGAAGTTPLSLRGVSLAAHLAAAEQHEAQRGANNEGEKTRGLADLGAADRDRKPEQQTVKGHARKKQEQEGDRSCG